MTSKDYQLKFEAFLCRNKFDFIFHNKFLFAKESDIIACKDMELYEYEFKIGESDFRKDIKKERHIDGCPNYFFYVVPDLNIINGDYYDYAGIYLHKFDKRGDSSFKLIKPPEKIRDCFITLDESYKLLTKIYNGKTIY